MSDTLTPEPGAPWAGTTRVVRRAGAHEQVAALRREPGRDILVFGSRTLWTDLLVAGLVDELHLMVGPAVLGAGVPAFSGVPRTPLELLEVRRLEDSQLVLLRYDAGARS